MTKIGIMSDLHIDSNHFGQEEIQTIIQVLEEQGIQHLHLAGDLANGRSKQAYSFLENIGAHFPVSFSLGNHDMLGLSEEEIGANEFQQLTFEHQTLLTLSGWYDYSFVPHIAESKHLQTKNLYWFDRRLHRIESDPEITKSLLCRLEEKLQSIPGDIAIAMHFVPHEQFLLRHPYFERFNAFLGSQAFHHLFTRYHITDVVFGHSHHRLPPTIIDGITYHSRPLGYIREWELSQHFFEAYPEFDFSKRYDLYKRYNRIKDLPEFQAYKRQHLAQEFRQALTILEL